MKLTNNLVATASCSERETFGRFLVTLKITSLVKELGMVENNFKLNLMPVIIIFQLQPYRKYCQRSVKKQSCTVILNL